MRIYKPVCGANMKTYNNECLAGCENVSVQYEGPCLLGSSAPDMENEESN